MPKTKKHLDESVNTAITKLCEALIQWERATGRQSVFVLRENNGEAAGQDLIAEGFSYRAMNGIRLDENNDDLSDDYILKPFTFKPHS